MSEVSAKPEARDMELAKERLLNQIEAQRSGFDLELQAQRNERGFGKAGSEGYGACVYKGQLGSHRRKYCAYQVGTYSPMSSG